MKRIFIIIACAAMMMACGGNKAQENKCGECKTKCEKQECGTKECKKECEKQKCEKQECGTKECGTKECGTKECGTKECEKKCEKQKCGAEKECEKQKCKKNCTEQTAGCITISGEEFTKLVADLSQPEWKYLGDKPAVVDFYADWCGPCKAIAPTLEEIAKEHAGELYIYKINVDNDPEIANAFNIVGIPTLLFIPMEGRYTAKAGAMPKEELVEIIKENCFK